MTSTSVLPTRRTAIPVPIGGIILGGSAPIAVQSMTDTATTDVPATVRQIVELAEAGSELVRLTVNSSDAAKAIPRIAESLYRQGTHVPLIGDFHYNGHQLLTDFPDCAQVLAKYRINPGNVGRGKSYDSHFARMIEIACRCDRPVRIGANWGSLDPQLLSTMMENNSRLPNPRAEQQVMEETLIQSALESARLAELYGLTADRIVLSAKVSGVQALIRVYRRLAEECAYPLHLGLTEAGPGTMGIVASATAMGILLEKGIGDTIRVSLTPAPGSKRAEEVLVARQLLQALGLRYFSPQITACPGCGRTNREQFQQMTSRIQSIIEQKTPLWKKRYTNIESLHVAVMGCVVNGPGESRHADIGISLPGQGEAPKAMIYTDGKLNSIVEGPEMVEQFLSYLECYLERKQN